MSAVATAGGRALPVARRGASASALALWGPCFAAVLAVHLGLAAFFLAPSAELNDVGSVDAIDVDLVPDPSTESAKPDDIAGPQVTESIAATSQNMEADDPDPPAPDSLPPTEIKKKLDEVKPELDVPPAMADASVTLPKPVEKLPDAEKAEEERQTVASRASNGSAGLLGGGRRPSPAAEASWRGEIGKHLVHFRRFPVEARNEGLQGTARVRVTIDTDGHVLGRDLIKSSGHAILDREALEMMNRSDPFPKPPSGMVGPIVLTVPVNFAIR